LEGVNFLEETDMEAARFIAIFIAVFVAIFLPLMALSTESRAAQDKARARRIADAKMNARLLRLNI
jgi:hypothetical protein